MVASFLSSFFQTAHADAPEESEEAQTTVEEVEEEEPEDVSPVCIFRNLLAFLRWRELD